MPLDPCYLDLLSALAPQIVWDSVKKERFSVLYDLLLETNQKMNITSLTDMTAVVIKHFADSLTLLAAPAVLSASKTKCVCDMGCGGGFPGLPIAIALPGLELTMIDSTEKKIRAVADNASRLGLNHVNAVFGRGEALGKPGTVYRESFDAVVSRAVASLPVLTELCLPLVKQGGVFIAMKGARVEEELEASRCGAGQLGSEKPALIPVQYPDVDLTILPESEREKAERYLHEERALVVFQKTRTTPDRFPRSWAIMKRKPL